MQKNRASSTPQVAPAIVKSTERQSQRLRLQRVFYVKRSTAAKILTWQSLTIGTYPLKGWTQAHYKGL